MNVKHASVQTTVFRILAAFSLGLLVGCGAAAPRPEVGPQLVTKANDFMQVAAILFSQGPPFWGQGLRSLYYSALTLARVKDIRAFSEATENFHTRVWGLSPLSIREYFGRSFKAVRIRHDYHALADPEDRAKADLTDFMTNGVGPFSLLIDQTEKCIQNDFRRCKKSPRECSYCLEAQSSACLRDKAIADLEKMRLALEKMTTALLVPASRN